MKKRGELRVWEGRTGTKFSLSFFKKLILGSVQNRKAKGGEEK